jgi:16S rRNA (cytosine967-C5)-methyltransferase
MHPGTRALADAARVVARVAHDGASASIELAPAVQAIAYGTLRAYLRLAPAIARVSSRARRSVDPGVHALLVTAAHQVVYSRHAPEGVVDAAVDAARALGAPRAAGFVNAVLRRFVREHAALFAELDRDPAIRYAHPRWFIEALRAAAPESWESVLIANDAHPPMTLRVDLSRGSREAYRAELAAAGHEASAPAWCPSALTLAAPAPVEALPGFADGRVSVQDAAAQLAAMILAPARGARVLDACAAPGGKTGHLLEIAGEADLLAVDRDPGRLALVHDNLARLGRRARLAALDLADTTALANEPPFDRILLDAPCSATGVIRRHPDIKLLRRASDIEPLAASQYRLLRNAFSALAPGGRLVYCTCSVLPGENEAVVARFLAATPAAADLGWPAGVPVPPGAQPRPVGVQVWPGAEAGCDGFYYACLGWRGGRATTRPGQGPT